MQGVHGCIADHFDLLYQPDPALRFASLSPSSWGVVQQLPFPSSCIEVHVKAAA
jgi:hypothetical protein